MTFDMEILRELNRQLDAKLSARILELYKMETDAKSVVVQCATERAILEKKRSQLDGVESIYRDILADPDDASVEAPVPKVAHVAADDGKRETKTRARVGAQRYAMLDCLRTMGPLTGDNIALITGLPQRRVGDQMAADLALSNVEKIDACFHITENGRDLMKRFEDSRRERGLPLPSIDPARVDKDDEADPETHEEGE